VPALSVHRSPCTAWPRLDLCCDCITDDGSGLVAPGLTVAETAILIDETFDYLEQLAFTKTGGIFTGGCQEWVRPNLCGCLGGCSCGVGYRPLDLRPWTDGADVVSIDSFVIDGYAWDPEEIRIDVHRYAVREAISGIPQDWPQQNYALQIGAPGTWEIEFTYGQDPDLIVLTAVRDMACERIKKCLNLPCSLNDNVASVNEQGRVINFRAPSDTNSGVDSWDDMMELYGLEEEIPRQFLAVPGGLGIELIGGTPGLNGMLLQGLSDYIGMGVIVGDDVTTTFLITHNLGTILPASVAITDDATGAYVPPLGPSITIVDVNSISIEFSTAPPTGDVYSVRVVG